MLRSSPPARGPCGIQRDHVLAIVLDERIVDKFSGEQSPDQTLELAHVFLPVPKGTQRRPLIREELRVDPRTVRRPDLEPSPCRTALDPCLIERPPLSRRGREEDQAPAGDREHRTE